MTTKAGRKPGSQNRTVTITVSLRAAKWIHGLCTFALATQNVSKEEAAPIRLTANAIKRAVPEHFCRCGERFATRGALCDRCDKARKREEKAS